MQKDKDKEVLTKKELKEAQNKTHLPNRVRVRYPLGPWIGDFLLMRMCYLLLPITAAAVAGLFYSRLLVACWLLVVDR